MMIRDRKVPCAALMALCGITVAIADIQTARAADENPAIKGWKKGTGWGWIWGKDDEVGALNAMTPETTLAALKLAKNGKTSDLGTAYSRNSFKWPGHSPGEVITFRSPEGVKRQRTIDFAKPEVNPDRHRLAQLRPVHQRQRRHADRRPGPRHRRRRQPLVQRLQGSRLGRQLRRPQVRRARPSRRSSPAA